MYEWQLGKCYFRPLLGKISQKVVDRVRVCANKIVCSYIKSFYPSIFNRCLCKNNVLTPRIVRNFFPINRFSLARSPEFLFLIILHIANVRVVLIDFLSMNHTSHWARRDNLDRSVVNWDIIPPRAYQHMSHTWRFFSTWLQ